MPLNKRQAPFQLSLMLSPVPPSPPCPPPRPFPAVVGLHVGAGWEGSGCAGTRGWCILAAAGGNGAAYITPWLGNEVKLRQLSCGSFQRVWGAAGWLKGKWGTCFSARGSFWGGAHTRVLACGKGGAPKVQAEVGVQAMVPQASTAALHS